MEKFELQQKVDEPKKSEQHFNTSDESKPKIRKVISVDESAHPGRSHGPYHGHNQPASVNKYDDVRRSDVPISSFHSVAQPNNDQSEGYCKNLHNNRKQTGSICGG